MPSTLSSTLVIAKPDAVERGLVGEILARLERKGLTITAARFGVISTEVARAHYAEHADRPFYGDLISFITRSASLVLAVSVTTPDAGDDAFAVVRRLVGATNPAQAEPGTIRGDFGLSVTENLIHASDSNESAARELELFFGSTAPTTTIGAPQSDTSA